MMVDKRKEIMIDEHRLTNRSAAELGEAIFDLRTFEKSLNRPTGCELLSVKKICPEAYQFFELDYIKNGLSNP